ncbi:MAG: hypothetical protein II649_11485 [Kiritimatiellae bacterium]|nr:hypothetical protein [Kiritimatiellia bacterium]
MAWNGYSSKNRQTLQKSHKASDANIRYHVIIGFGAILALGLVATLLVCGTNNPAPEEVTPVKTSGGKKQSIPSATRTKGNLIKISTREPVRTRMVAKPELTDENPIVRQKALGRVVKWEHRNGPPLFTNRFESLVCEIMTAEPGERFLELDIEEDFDDTFNESLNHRITISSDDSETVKFMKQTVIDAKEQVRRLVLQGTSARDVIIEARNELNKIADYRDELQKVVNEYLVTATDPIEALKLVQEANEILAEYGAMPVDGPDDEETAYELMLNAKEERIKEIDAASPANKEEE